jgi:hypothetical protein
VQLIAGILGRAGEAGQRKRLEAAERGDVTWETPRHLTEWNKEQFLLDKERALEAKKLLDPQKGQLPEKLAKTKEDLLMMDQEVEPVV